MDLEINRPVGPVNLVARDVKTALLDNVLLLGQSLKAVVLTPLNNGEVTIDINGQSVNAKTSYPFTPGETLDVKVTETENEIVLQVQQASNQPVSAQKTIQNALLQTLPKQAPPTNLLDSLEQLVEPKEPTLEQINKLLQLPPQIVQQLKTLLNTIPNVEQLPQQIAKIVNQSGVFLESALLQAQPGDSSEQIQGDLKAQFLKLLNSLPIDLKSTLSASSIPVEQILPGRTPLLNEQANLPGRSPLLNEQASSAPSRGSTPYEQASPAPGRTPLPYENTSSVPNRDPLPLPGAIPQPLHKDAVFNLMDKSPQAIQTVIHEQINQALSRITANQVNHLSQTQFSPDDNKTGFLIMMDIPVKTPQNNIDVIPLMIKQRKATATLPTQWSISFALSLSELGDMQGTVTLNGNDVHVKINSDNQEAIDTLNLHQHEIHSLIGQLGLSLGGFNLQLGLENNHIETENLHLLDIRI